ncbi:YibE/F family protein [Crassaminicella thermophila]|uniref:YibE/F family protein n=1 Tax=Crassaminicella thermophila TaxID=2599308 RepID=A0A5C0SFQ8_CRATE|nr:YibE/F family protein [Crassaminicella thermophila]QEK13323.1 YibE/F family protein [Crassaminicella thermophila]
MKKYFLLIGLFILIVSFNVYAEEENPFYTETAVVLDASETKIGQEYEGFTEKYQLVKLEVTSGKYKGKVFEIENNIADNYGFAIAVKKGDKVIVNIEENEDGNVDVFITEYMRQHYIIYLSILFILLIVVIGRTKGIKAVITLTLTMVAILKILLPMILKGVNPIPLTIAISISITVITMFFIGGFNSKTIAAIIGTSGGVLIAGLVAYYIGSQVKLTGLSSEEAIMLMDIPQGIVFDFKSLLFSGIIMGALGAVMDIGMSISSAMEEIHNANKTLTRKELFSAGMNVGKDVMGTMTNTLILAYTGSSIPLLLLFMAYETSIVKILNLDIIATEVIRSLAGSIGLVLTIPLTAFVASLLMKKNEK